MALPASGVISASDINTELARTAGTSVSLGNTAIRDLADKSGQISYSDFYSKTRYQAFSQTTTSVSQISQGGDPQWNSLGSGVYQFYISNYDYGKTFYPNALIWPVMCSVYPNATLTDYNLTVSVYLSWNAAKVVGSFSPISLLLNDYPNGGFSNNPAPGKLLSDIPSSGGYFTVTAPLVSGWGWTIDQINRTYLMFGCSLPTGGPNPDPMDLITIGSGGASLSGSYYI